MTLSHSLALSLFHSPYFLLFKTLQQKFLIAYSLPFSFLPSLSLFPLLALSFTLSVFLSVSGSILHVSFRPASGLLRSAAMQLDRYSFPVPFYFLLTSLFILTLSWAMSFLVLVFGHSYECCHLRAFDKVGLETSFWSILSNFLFCRTKYV